MVYQLCRRPAPPPRALPVTGGGNQTVKELFRCQPLERHAGKQPDGLLSRMAKSTGALVSLTVGDGPDEKLRVEIVLYQFSGQFGQQFGMAGRIVVVEVIDRIDDPYPKEMLPQAIG